MAFNFGFPPAPGPAPNPGGFNFGGGAGAGTSASGSTSAPVAPQPGGFGFGGTANAPAAATPSTLTIPCYDELFPGRLIWNKIGSLLRTTGTASEDSALAGQELIHLLNQKDSSIVTHLLQPNSAMRPVRPDQALRQRLVQNPTVTLSIQQNDDGSVKHQDGSLTQKMLQDVFAVADDLQISEAAAICLYQQACCQTAPFRSKLVQNCLERSSVEPQDTRAWTARELYVAQRSLLVRTCLLLLQNRLQDGGHLTCEATDALLQSGWIDYLVQTVRGYTQQIEQILEVMKVEQPISGDSSQFWRWDVTIQSLAHERQVAADCLFFTAYHVQLKPEEVAALIDLVRELSDKQPVLNPYTDVPDPYERPDGAQAAIGSAQFQFFLQHQLQKKDFLVWQRELVRGAWKTGQPDLVRCNCTLIMAIVSSLGDRAALMDRHTHKANSFGVGNALLPPESTSTESLSPIHSRLSGDGAMGWQRPDVLGLLKAAYAMLLRSSPAGLSSPRGMGASPGGAIDVRKTWRECIEAPAVLKSFTFARLTLVPALQKPPSYVREDYNNLATAESCNVEEFFLSVLAEFSSHYLEVLSVSGDRPISRAKWEQDAEDDLRLRRSHQEQQRSFQGQFRAWSATDAVDDVPSAIDLYDRPDCMDDVVAFSAAVCSLGSEYALPFWSQIHVTGEKEEGVLEEFVKLEPSRALRELASQQKDDDSLRPSYLSFLAALALAKNPTGGEDGAAEVHRMLSGGDASGLSSRKHPNWTSLIEILRWYVRELDPQGYSSRGTSSSTSSGGTSAVGSTAYYYFDQPGDSTTFGSEEQSSSEDASSRSRPRELGDENTYVLLSHLAVIANVAAHSSAARSAIVSVNLPIQSPDGTEIIGQDSTLMVLFSLAVMPLSPEIRGAVFETIACLLSVDGASTEETAALQKAAMKGWELLEACQVVPISILEQYPSGQEAGVQSSAGLSFPPSSTAMALNRRENSWIPADPRFAILYELEYIEFSSGHYPSSEGFLKLLASLFAVGGCPSDLGKNWRVRSGCSPYIEYVIDYLLPRANGKFANLPALPFRSSEDQSRLVSLSLSVVKAVLYRYVLPCMAFPHETSPDRLATLIYKATQGEAHRVLGQTQLANEVALAPHVADAMLSMEDFQPKFMLNMEAKATADYHVASEANVTRSPLPYPKSPGYSILAEMLSCVQCGLFKSLVSILVDRKKASAAEVDYDSFALAYALYVSTPPTFLSAEEGAKQKRDVPASSRQFLIKPLRPTVERSAHFSGTYWLDQTILGALQILCAAIARETLLQRCIDSAPGQLNFAPVLRFQKKSLIPTIIDLRVGKLSRLLTTSGSRGEVMSSIIDLIGFVSSRESIDASIASAAASIVFYIAGSLPSQQIVDIFVREGSQHGRTRLSFAVEKRFLVASARTFSRANVEVLRLLSSQILLDLRSDGSFGESLAHTILGLPISALDAQLEQGSQDFRDGLDSLLQLIDVNEFVFGANCADLASCCFEILYRLTILKPSQGGFNCVLYCARRLRALNFWKSHLSKIFQFIFSTPFFSTVENFDVFHSIAWLLKGAANELHLSAGFSSTGSGQLIAPLPSHYKNLSEALFSVEGLVAYALRVLPIRRPSFESIASVPSEQAVNGAKEILAGAPEVVTGYETINENRLIEITRSNGVNVSGDGLLAWVEQWNRSVAADCASAHLSDAIHIALGASVCSSKFTVFQLPPGSTPGNKLLVHIMECMTLEGDPNTSSQILDKVFFTTACRNLALAALMASSSASSIGYDTSPSESSVDTLAALNLLARAIGCSGGSQVGPDSVRRNERVAILASALLLILRDLPDNQLREGDQYQMFQASLVLSKLAVTVLGNTLPAVPSTESLIARSCLSMLLDILESSWPENKEPCCHAVLTDGAAAGSSAPAIVAMIQLLPLLDGTIATLLQKLSEFPRTADLLIEYGILDALRSAGESYRDEEARFLASEAHSVPYGQGQTNVVTPRFLQGHLDLMGALLSSQVPGSRLFDILPKIIAIIRCYDSVIERLLGCFPLDGDVLFALWRCLAQANAVIRSDSSTGDVSTTSLLHRLTDEIGAPYLRNVAMLTLHIAENPLPSRFLGMIPSRLKTSHTFSAPVVVTTAAATGEKCWWDTIDSQSEMSTVGRAPDLSLTDDLCRLALLGSDLMRYGLSLIRGSGFVVSGFDENALCRALWRCADAANRIGIYLASFRPLQTGDFQTAKQQQLILLRSKFTTAVVELFQFCITRIRAMRKDQVEGAGTPMDSFCKSLAFTLDQIEILGFFTNRTDENNFGYASGIAELLRRELQHE